jgi:hypothetical protein
MLPRRERVVFMALKSTADAIKKALFKAQKWARKCETPRVAFLVEQIFLGDVAQLVRALPSNRLPLESITYFLGVQFGVHFGSILIS